MAREHISQRRSNRISWVTLDHTPCPRGSSVHNRLCRGRRDHRITGSMRGSRPHEAPKRSSMAHSSGPRGGSREQARGCGLRESIGAVARASLLGLALGRGGRRLCERLVAPLGHRVQVRANDGDAGSGDGEWRHRCLEEDDAGQ
eukprot:scaffold9487_cov105-Isochrysis_galbana.AAC.4